MSHGTLFSFLTARLTAPFLVIKINLKMVNHMCDKEVTKTCEDLRRAGNNNAACIKVVRTYLALFIVFWYPSMTSS